MIGMGLELIYLTHYPIFLKIQFLEQPYFASDNLLAQEDFTKFQNYLDFVKANPNEKSRILKYLEKLIKEDPIEVDIAFEFASEEELKLFEETKEVFGKIPSSVFIVKFDSTQRAASKRYKLATVDIR